MSNKRVSMEEDLNDIARSFLFSENSETTRDAILDACYDYLNQRTDVRSYQVRCDEGNNDAARVARGEIWIDVTALHQGDDQPTHYVIRVSSPMMVGEDGE